MDFESAMQTFAEAWMAANRSGLVLGENPNKNSKSSPILPDQDSKAADEEKVSDFIFFQPLDVSNVSLNQFRKKEVKPHIG